MSTPYETETWRQPTVQDGDTVVFSEHGRSVNHVDFKSHWLMLVKAHYGGYWLCVKHGGGEERISIGYHHTATGLLALSALEADARYLVLYTLYTTHSDATRQAREATAHRYQLAFLEGRLKRKQRNHRVRVEMLPPVTAPLPSGSSY